MKSSMTTTELGLCGAREDIPASDRREVLLIGGAILRDTKCIIEEDNKFTIPRERKEESHAVAGHKKEMGSTFFEVVLAQDLHISSQLLNIPSK